MRQYKGGSHPSSGGPQLQPRSGHAHPPPKLPKTGIEQPMMKDRPRFIEMHREFERVAPLNVSIFINDPPI